MTHSKAFPTDDCRAEFEKWCIQRGFILRWRRADGNIYEAKGLKKKYEIFEAGWQARGEIMGGVQNTPDVVRPASPATNRPLVDDREDIVKWTRVYYGNKAADKMAEIFASAKAYDNH